MPRAKFIQDPEALYHVSARCRNRDWFEVPMPEVWSVMSDSVLFAYHAFGVQTLSFVLMDNHFHWINKAPLGNLSPAMQRFMGDTSRALQEKTGRINQIWGSRFFRSRLGDYHYVLNCYKYVYRNPVEAGLCKRVEDYPFSTLHGILGRSRHLIPTPLETMLFENGVGETLDWLNKAPTEEALSAIRRGLRHSDFRLARVQNRPSPWETNLI